MKLVFPLPRFCWLLLSLTGLTAAAIANDGPLQKVAEYRLHQARVGAAVAALGDHLYVFGGSGGSAAVYQAERMDLRTGEVELLSPRFVARRFHNVIEHEGKFWIFGGQSYQRPATPHEAAAEIYDPVTNTVTRAADCPDPRSKAGAVKLGEEAFVIGGTRHRNSGSYAQTNTSLLLDLRTGNWREGLPMPTPREAPAVAVGPFVLVAGGYASKNKHDAVEMFVPGEQAWKKLPKLNRTISAHSAAVLGRWLFLFGDFSDGRVVLSYDLPTRETRRIDSGFTATQFSTALTYGDRIYVVGGAGEDFGQAGGGRARNLAQSGGSERNLVQVFALRSP
jgi:hypothetical protein